MSKHDFYAFMTQNEFNMLCDMRIDVARDRLYATNLAIREQSPNYGDIVQRLDTLMLEISRVKIDIEDAIRRLEVK